MVQKLKIRNKTEPCWMNKDQLCNKLQCLVAFLIASRYWERVSYDNSQFSNIFDNVLILAFHALLYGIMM